MRDVKQGERDKGGKRTEANWLDRAISWASPEAGERRINARQRMASGYSGARRSRRTEEWNTSKDGANDALRFDLPTLRDRSRDLVRNTPDAASAIRALAAAQVGCGIMPLIRKGPNAKEFRDAWQWFCDSADFDGDTDFYGLQALAARCMVESGEAVILKRPRPSSSGLKVPLQLQVLEPDYIDDTKNFTGDATTNSIIQGVELNPQGQRVAYWLFDRHPGESGRKLVSRRVRAEYVIHLYRKDRPGQLRAAPWLAPVITTIRDLADYDEAELYSKKLQATVSEHVRLTDNDSSIAPQQVDTDGRKKEKMEPGIRLYLKPGEDRELVAPPIVPGYPDYKRAKQLQVASGVGMTYEMLTGDLSNVNYSSYRAGYITFRAFNDQIRDNLWVAKCCRGVWAAFEATAQAVGLVEGAPNKLGWIPPAYDSVDPLKDYKATLIAVRAGFKSLRHAITEQGYDADTVLDEIAEGNADLDDRRIIVDSDPRNSTAQGALQGDTAPADQPQQKNEQEGSSNGTDV